MSNEISTRKLTHYSHCRVVLSSSFNTFFLMKVDKKTRDCSEGRRNSGAFGENALMLCYVMT